MRDPRVDLFRPLPIAFIGDGCSRQALSAARMEPATHDRV